MVVSRFHSDRLRRIILRTVGATEGDRNPMFRALDDVDRGVEGRSVVRQIIDALRRIRGNRGKK